ncbi:MAG: hypothetical protein ACLVES_04230 [Faecalibacterium prausnitzii]
MRRKLWAILCIAAESVGLTDVTHNFGKLAAEGSPLPRFCGGIGL